MTTTKLILAILALLLECGGTQSGNVTKPYGRWTAESEHSTTAVYKAATTARTAGQPRPQPAKPVTTVRPAIEEAGESLGDWSATWPLTNALSSTSSIGSTINGALELFRSVKAGFKEKLEHPFRTALELVRLLEVPLPDGLSETCAGHIRLFVNELLSTVIEMRNPLYEWSVQMFDAIAKPPPGITKGTVVWPGSFSQCVNIVVMSNGSTGLEPRRVGDPNVAFVGEHCMVKLDLPTDILPKAIDKIAKSFPNETVAAMSFAVCFPNTCDLNDKRKLMEYVTSPLKLHVTIEDVQCYMKEGRPMDTTGIALTIVFFVPIALVLAGTILDWWRKRSLTNSQVADFEQTESLGVHLLLKFSAFRSLGKLFAMQTEHTNSFHFMQGIRFLSVAWVIYGHTFLALDNLEQPNSELLNLLDIAKTGLVFPILSSGPYSVETFFFIGGFCSIYFALLTYNTKQTSVLQFLAMYYKRYFRLTPSLAYVIVFVAGPWRFLGNGPFWAYVPKCSDRCREVWWTDLLYIGNLVREYGQNCQGQTWYLIVDMQLYLMVPPLLLIMLRKPRWTFPVVTVLLLASVAARLFLILGSNMPFVAKVDFEYIANLNLPRAMDNYQNPFFRAPTYIQGAILGYFLYSIKTTGVRMKPYMVALGWISCISTTTIVVWMNYPFNHGLIEPSETINSFVGATSCSAWSLAIGWIVLACATGYGGLVTTILSCPPFVILGRLTFSIFLTHSMLISTRASLALSSETVDSFDMLCQSVVTLVFVTATSTALFVLIECPVDSMRKKSFNQRTKSGPQPKRETDLCVPTDYTMLLNEENIKNTDEMSLLLDNAVPSPKRHE